MKCAYCSEITRCSCPEHKFEEYKDAKYVCDVCMRLMGEGVKEEELNGHPKREEMKNDL